jgi:hypothetical protein
MLNAVEAGGTVFMISDIIRKKKNATSWYQKIALK